jgi:hypothetical protein
MVWMMLMACSLRSGLQIEAGSQFVLGDNPHRSFSARVRNAGEVPVRVRSGEQTIAEVAPGESARARFAPGEAAIFVNQTDTPAQLDVRVRGDVRLSMGYEAARLPDR